MRILRRKSSREVSSNGFALFVIGLVLATFIGGAVRTLLKSDRIHQRIVAELRSRLPQHEIRVGHTEVLLSHGLWPGFGLKVDGLQIKQDVCGKLSFTLDVPEAVLPVDVLSVREGNLRLRQVQIHRGRLHLNYRECATRLEPGSLPSTNPAEGGNPAPGGAKGRVPPIQPLRLDWKSLSQHLDGLHLNQFTVTYERNVTWKLSLHEADIRFGEELQYGARLDVQKSLPFGGLVHTVDVEGRGVGRVLSWDVRSEFKEGRMAWNGSWDLDTNLARTGLNIHQLPMKDFLFELFQMGFLRQEISLKATWLTGDLEWEGKVANYRDFPLRIREFTFVGGYGRIELADPVELKMVEDWAFRIPALLKVNQLQLQPIAEALKVSVLPRVLSRLGVWSGTLLCTNWRDWKLDGYLENLEVAFSNQSVRGKQAVRRLHSVLSRAGQRLDGVIDEAVIHDGEFLGLINVSWNDQDSTGDVKVRLDRLSFSPAIQNLLVGGEVAPLKVQGEGRLNASGMTDWNAMGEVAWLHGRGWKATNLQIKSKSQNENVRMDLNLEQLSLGPSWRFGSQLRELGEDWADGVHWKNINGQIALTKTGGEASGFSAQDASKGYTWRGNGAWVRDGDLKASLSATKAGSSSRFSVHGNSSDVQIDRENSVIRQ